MDIADSIGLHPWPSSWAIEFTIQIPDPVQKEILERYLTLPDPSKTTEFNVQIRYDGNLPVTFISGVDAILLDPSDSIILIREHMKKCAPAEMPIEFQWLGPSPFHVKFFVYSSDGDEFQVIRERKRATYNPPYPAAPPCVSRKLLTTRQNLARWTPRCEAWARPGMMMNCLSGVGSSLK